MKLMNTEPPDTGECDETNEPRRDRQKAGRQKKNPMTVRSKVLVFIREEVITLWRVKKNDLTSTLTLLAVLIELNH